MVHFIVLTGGRVQDPHEDGHGMILTVLLACNVVNPVDLPFHVCDHVAGLLKCSRWLADHSTEVHQHHALLRRQAWAELLCNFVPRTKSALGLDARDDLPRFSTCQFLQCT